MKKYYTDQEWEQINKFSAHKEVVSKPLFTGVHAFWISFFLTCYVLCICKAYGVLY